MGLIVFSMSAFILIWYTDSLAKSHVSQCLCGCCGAVLMAVAVVFAGIITHFPFEGHDLSHCQLISECPVWSYFLSYFISVE